MAQIIGYILFTVLILFIAKAYLDKKGHPKALFYLFFAEMWERFSFYGMRALLTLYLIKDYYSSLENNEDIAYGIYAAYGALVYLTPLIGGYLADKFIGYRKSIIYGGILMAMGHFCMAFPSDFFFYGALGLLILGNGFFKPNISTLVGSLYEEGDLKRDGGFTIFYMGINLGAMIAPLFCGYLGEVYGWHWGFGAAGIGMLAGLVVFWKGITANVLGDKGLQPAAYIGKKIAGLSVSKFIYGLGFLAVPAFAYLIILDTQAARMQEPGMLGDILTLVGAIVLIYVFYLIYGYKSGKPESLTISNLFSFKGRIRRSQYAISHIIVIMVWVLFSLGFSLVFELIWEAESTYNWLINSIIWTIGYIILSWLSIAQAVKRCNDIGKPWWFMFIPFYVFVLLFKNGHNETNEHGSNVKENNIEHNKSADRLIAIMILAVFCTIFWACFEQAGSSITVWVDKCVKLVGMTASQTNAINPFYIVLLAIPFSWLWTKLGAMKRNPNTPIKFSLGLLQLALGFVIFGLSIHFVDETTTVPFLFVFLGYFLITTGELFLSPIGLSKITQLAPKKIIAFMMGVWFLSSTFAHYISGGIAKMTTEPFYNEGATFIVDNGDDSDTYTFDLRFNYKNNLTNIQMIESQDSIGNRNLVSDVNFTQKDKQEISKLIAYELTQNEDDFWWEIDDKGRLTLSLKTEKKNVTSNDEDQEYINQIKNSFKTGVVIENESKGEENFFERVASFFPWEFLSSEETAEINEEYTSPNFDLLKDSSSFISIHYQTNESIQNKKDAIAGISYISDKEANTNWDSSNRSNLAPGIYQHLITSSNKNIHATHYYKIEEGPSDWLSKTTNKLLGSPVINKKPIATLLQYNIIYLKIGIVTIIIALFVLIISPFIKKLMHGIH